MATLFIIATPIGNLEDITVRAIRVLSEVDALACEDTRHTRIIFARHGMKSPRVIFSYREQNETAAGERIIEMLSHGQSVGLCSDAGYPGISDPGYRIITRALGEGHRIEVIPGASAAIPALLASGLPTSSFTFKGFPPKKPGPRSRFLAMEKASPHTLIFYESPFRLLQFLAAAHDVLGNRLAAVCSELTKKFEHTRRGTLDALYEHFKVQKIKGEIVVVIAGNNPKFTGDAEESGD